MNHNLQIFKEKILQENLSKTETYWIDQIDFQIVDNDLNLCVNSEFVKTSIEKKHIFLETVRIMIPAQILLKSRYLIEMEKSVDL